jgi:D-amino-acid dehydrogenase
MTHVVVIGTGVVGCTTAYALQRAGAEVTLIDGAAAPATGASFANGAQLSYSYVEPLATPAALRKVPLWLLSPDSPLRLRIRADPAQWRWLYEFTVACRAARVRRTTRELLELSFASRETLHRWMHEEQARGTPLAFQHARNGKLVLFATQQALESAEQQVDMQRPLGCTQQLLDLAGCIEREPALASCTSRVVGGVWTPSEEVGDPHALCLELTQRLRERGARLLLDTPVTELTVQAGRVTGLDTAAGQLSAEHVVLCAGAGSRRLARSAGLSLSIEPIKGYSVTLSVTRPGLAPRVSVTDFQRKVVYAPLGNTLRVAGMAELVGEDLAIDPRRIAHLVRCAQQMFPGATDTRQTQPWAGLRPATPRGLPLVGPSSVSNLWLNTGHGALGFTLACGSAQRVATGILGAQ